VLHLIQPLCYLISFIMVVARSLFKNLPLALPTIKVMHTVANSKPTLMDRVVSAIKLRHLSPRTQDAYTHWMKRFIVYHNKRHPAEMGENEIRLFLTHPAEHEHVSASTQNQAFNAIVFLYRHVLDKKLGTIAGVVRARKPKRLPVVLNHEEVCRILSEMSGVPRLMASLLYGSGLPSELPISLASRELRVSDLLRDELHSSIHPYKPWTWPIARCPCNKNSVSN